MGSIDAWFYKYLAGIQPDESSPAFSSFRVKPVIPDSLYSAKATIETIRGTISSQWSRDTVTIHPESRNSVQYHSRNIYLPGKQGCMRLKNPENRLRESVGIEYQGYSENYHIFKVGSGKYKFTLKD